MKKSSACLPTSSESSISIYTGELTAQCLVKSIAMIKKSFPSLPIGFYDVFTDRLRANGFTDERLSDAVVNVIDTCVYPAPTIAQFISFDKRIKTFTYDQYCKFCDEGTGKYYEPVKFKNRPVPVWIHVNDIVMYNIKSE